MTRYRWLLRVTGLALLAGCSGADRELLGDPEPAPPPAAAARDTPDESELDASNSRYDAPADSLEMFADLRFYGSWYWLDPFGWVWNPVVVSAWRPFANGHWVWTTHGWMWISYDPFGWATFYYGYWVYDFTLGWVWIPDYEWAPARCDWLVYDDYVCWAPIPPPQVRYKDPWERNDIDPWVVVPRQKFKSIEVAQYRVPAKFKAGYSERTLHREPPDSETVQRWVGQPIQLTSIQLEKATVGSRELTRVVLPPEQQTLVDQLRAPHGRMKSDVSRIVDETRRSGGSDGSAGESQATSKSPPPARKEQPAKFKEKAKEEKDSSEKSKSGEKSKSDDSKKDDDKEKGKDKGR